MNVLIRSCAEVCVFEGTVIIFLSGLELWLYYFLSSKQQMFCFYNLHLKHYTLNVFCILALFYLLPTSNYPLVIYSLLFFLRHLSKSFKKESIISVCLCSHLAFRYAACVSAADLMATCCSVCNLTFCFLAILFVHTL